MNNFYKIMGLAENASHEEIKKQYKRLARKYHPDLCDLGQSTCETKMIELNQAYEVLSHSDKKEKYDEHGHDTYHMHHHVPEDDNHFDYAEGIHYYLHDGEDISISEVRDGGVSIEIPDPLTGELFNVHLPQGIGLGPNKLKIKNRGFVKNGVRGNLFYIVNIVN